MPPLAVRAFAALALASTAACGGEAIESTTDHTDDELATQRLIDPGTYDQQGASGILIVSNAAGGQNAVLDSAPFCRGPLKKRAGKARLTATGNLGSCDLTIEADGVTLGVVGTVEPVDGPRIMIDSSFDRRLPNALQGTFASRETPFSLITIKTSNDQSIEANMRVATGELPFEAKVLSGSIYAASLTPACALTLKVMRNAVGKYVLMMIGPSSDRGLRCEHERVFAPVQLEKVSR
jgi:hypothetical protein